jgi:Virulence factor SrfB
MSYETAKEFILRLFPNTGHQFFALDLDGLLARRRDPQGRPIPAPSPDQLRRFVELQQPDKAPANRRDKVAGWLPWSPETPWILYRYDFMADPRSGIEDIPSAANSPQQCAVLLLAIESNLGDLDRGILLGLSSAPTGCPLPDHPAFSELQRRNTPLPERDAEIPPPYFSRPLELRSDWPEGGLWLEDAFASPNVPLPCRLTPQERREFDFILPRETVRIEWAESQGDRPVEVDLIVDLGNSRTVALLLEDHGADAGNLAFGKRVEPVHFLPRGWAYNHPLFLQNRKLEPFGIIDSWILLHRSTFANIEPPFSGAKLRTFVTSLPTRPGEEAAAYLVDQRFTSIAPVLVGGGKDSCGAARTLARAVTLRDSEGAPFFLSSPKRYAWDDTSIGSTRQYWKQVPNAHDADQTMLAPLEGLVRLLMNPSSRDNDLPPREIHDAPFDPPTDSFNKAKYPRSDAICWFALAILETAYRQINSIDFLRRTFPERGGLVRRLRRVRVTYPAGWSGQERERYLDQWRRACSLFALAHLTRGDQTPELVSPDTNIDEAIASQLPLVVAEIKNLGHDAEQWLTLFGDGVEARLLSLDIGGGTTDIAVVAYTRPEQSSGGAELASSILYRDGHTTAGDVLVKELVETLILPAWLKLRGDLLFAGNADARRLLEALFRSPGQQSASGLEAHLSQILRLALIPLANEILAKVNDAERQGLAALPSIRVARTADVGAIVELNRLVLRQLILSRCLFGDLRASDLNRLQHEPEFRSWFEKLRSDTPQKLPFSPTAELVFTLAEVRAVIDKVFTPVVRLLAEVVHEHKVNLVIVSGKPSELIHMRTILHRELPLPAQRIIQMRGHWVGDWYPVTLVEDGRIRDAKTVTVTGAALFEDIFNRNTTGFRLIQQAIGVTAAGDETSWGVLKAQTTPPEFDESYPVFSVGSKNQPLDFPLIPLETIFGRRLTRNGRAEPVYRLDYVVPAGVEPPKTRDMSVRVRVRRVDLPGGIGDALEIVPGSVSIVSGPAGLDPSCVHLRLRTMVEDSFWMDKPGFLVNFSNIGSK